MTADIIDKFVFFPFSFLFFSGGGGWFSVKEETLQFFIASLVYLLRRVVFMLDRIVCIPSNVVVTSFVVSCHWPGCRSSVTFLTGVVITSCTTSLKIVFIFFVPPHIYVTLKKALYSVRWLFLRRFRVIFAITLREILTFRDLILAFICIFFFHLFCSSHSGVLILFFLISFSRLMVSETFWFFLLTNGVLVLNLLFSPDLTIIIFFYSSVSTQSFMTEF